jgi:hypothetical protein
MKTEKVRQLADKKGEIGVRKEPNHATAKKAWHSITQSILYDSDDV